MAAWPGGLSVVADLPHAPFRWRTNACGRIVASETDGGRRVGRLGAACIVGANAGHRTSLGQHERDARITLGNSGVDEQGRDLVIVAATAVAGLDRRARAGAARARAGGCGNAVARKPATGSCSGGRLGNRYGLRRAVAGRLRAAGTRRGSRARLGAHALAGRGVVTAGTLAEQQWCRMRQRCGEDDGRRYHGGHATPSRGSARASHSQEASAVHEHSKMMIPQAGHRFNRAATQSKQPAARCVAFSPSWPPAASPARARCTPARTRTHVGSA